MMVFLEMNGLKLNCTDDELIALGLDIANNSLDGQSLMKWIFDHS